MMMGLSFSFSNLVSTFITYSLRLIIPILLGILFLRSFGGSQLGSHQSSLSMSIMSIITFCTSSPAPSGRKSSTSILWSDVLPSEYDGFNPVSKSKANSLASSTSAGGVPVPGKSTLAPAEGLPMSDHPTSAPAGRTPASDGLTLASTGGAPASDESASAQDCLWPCTA